MMKKFRYHPEIEGLKVNEDGTEILLNEAKLDIKIRKERNNSNYIYYRNKRITVVRLVLESWIGLSPEPKMAARFKDGNYENTHYTNLEWKTNGGNPKYDEKKQLFKNQKSEILEALKEGKSMNQISKEFGINRNLLPELKKELEK